MGADVVRSETAKHSSAASPTEECPEYGEVVTLDVVISAARRWIAPDGEHVIQSSEFEVYGEGQDWEEALSVFKGHAIDLVLMLSAVSASETDELTERERKVVKVLGPRVLEAVAKERGQLEAEIETLERRRLNLRRRRREHPVLRVLAERRPAG